jgi:hypothetical protein
MRLFWHNYKYLPYEKVFAIREIEKVLKPIRIVEDSSSFLLTGKFKTDDVKRLVYFSKAQINNFVIETLQFKLERDSLLATNKESKRQATRYSVHGLHEYKGKFNPQVVRGILNILGINKGNTVLDPFCGSGTSLVECMGVGINAIGFDVNPLATFIANAKLTAINTPVSILRNSAVRVFKNYEHCRTTVAANDERLEYLARWFLAPTLKEIEKLRCAINEIEHPLNNIFLTIASNLLREYSLQDPSDLRIRRRKCPLPQTPLFVIFKQRVDELIKSIEVVQNLMTPCEKTKAYNLDTKHITRKSDELLIKPPFDAAITSPPYATALPYIDTQRLSLVWVGLCKPNDILSLDADLIGSREFRGKGKSEWCAKLESNSENLPRPVVEFCIKLYKAVGVSDGFRRRAVPSLLYRYFSDMQKTFSSVRKFLKQKAPFALIIGHNRTTLGGKCFKIDTPSLLAEVAINTGWKVIENTPLETYKRYGINKNNAVLSETLMVLGRK